MLVRIQLAICLCFGLLVFVLATSPVIAQQSCGCDSCDDCRIESDQPAEEDQPQGPGYCGSICERSYLTGDWFGRRSGLAEKGITFQGDLTQFYQGTTSGGLRRHFKYGGHLDYVFDFDMDKLASAEGLFIRLRGETQFGEFINRDTGAIIAANTSGLLPTAGGQKTALSEFTLTQFLSKTFAVFGGKVQTFDGDFNAFAHGRGKTQFMNVAFTANPIAFRTIPYSALGFGFAIFQEEQPVFTFSVLDTQNRPTTFNLDDIFEEGVVLNAEARLPTKFFGLPGHQLLGGVWSSQNVALLSQDPRLLLPPTGLPLQRQSDSWALYWNFDQYIWVDPCDPTKGWGLFGRAAIADDETNPLDWFLSFGIGGNSRIAGRTADTFGFGWAYSGTSDQLPGVFLGDHGQSVESFYNFQVTPWMHVTTDLQVIDPALRGVDNSLVLGLRANVDF